MPVYAYKGFDASGKAITGTYDADNPRSIKQILRRDGIFLTELVESNTHSKQQHKRHTINMTFLQERVTAQDLAVATRQLATLIGAGITLVDALIALIDQIDKPHFKSVWADIKQRVNGGISLGDALSMHPRVFSGLYINMVRAGESSGALDVVLNRLADFTESQAELSSKLIGTMVYPLLMIVMACVVIAILFIFVIPKISKIFESQKVALPLPTQILMGASSIFKDWWFVIFFVMACSIYGFKRYIQSASGRPKWDKFILDVPIFGPLIRMVAVTRFCKTLSTLLKSGVPLLGAFDIVKNVVQNTVLLEVIEKARDCVKEGESIAAPLKRSKQFPPIVTHMISIGEKSGQLEDMLANIARSYDVQVEARLRGMTSILEPILLIFMGIIVAFIVFSVLLPMLQISSFA